jgi:hypothetical protein
MTKGWFGSAVYNIQPKWLSKDFLQILIALGKLCNGGNLV